MFNPRLVFLVLFPLLFTAIAPASAQTRGGKIISIEQQSIEVGMGFDSLKGEFVPNNKCITFLEATRDGTETNVRLREVTDKNSLAASVEINDSLKADMLLGKAEGKVGFTGNVKLNTSSQSFSAFAHADSIVYYAAPVPTDRVTPVLQQRGGKANTVLNIPQAEADAIGKNPPETAKILLGEEYADLAEKDRDAFFRSCGDAYVRSMGGGAEIIGVVTFVTSSLEVQAEIRSAMKSSGASWEASEEAKAKLTEFADMGRLELDYYQSGGKDEDIPTNWEEILANVRKINTFAQNPRFYQVEVVPYALLDNWPSGTQDVAEPDRNPLMYHYAAYETIFNAAERALKHDKRDKRDQRYLFGRGISIEQLEDLSDDLKDEIASLLPRLEACGETSEEGAEKNCAADGLTDPYEFRLGLPLEMTSPDTTEDPIMTEAFYTNDALREALADQVLLAPRESACAHSSQHSGCIKRAYLRDLVSRLNVKLPDTDAFEHFYLSSAMDPAKRCVSVSESHYPYLDDDCDYDEERSKGYNTKLALKLNGALIFRHHNGPRCISTEKEKTVYCYGAGERPVMRWRLVDYKIGEGPQNRLAHGMLLNEHGTCLQRSEEYGIAAVPCDQAEENQRWNIEVRQ